MNWTNMDASIGLNFNFFDSNSHYFSRLIDNSLSLGVLFQSEPQNHMLMPNDDGQNTINFTDLPFKLQQGDKIEPLVSFGQGPGDQEDSPESVSQRQSNKFRKGLKDLAKLLLQTIRNSESFSQAEILRLIESQLFHLKYDKIEEKLRTQKNIKRRIYDALNVMISAGLLQRSTSHIKIRPKQTLQKFCESSKGQIELVRSRIQKKRELLNKLKSQKKALWYWMRHNQSTITQAQKRLMFPLVFVLKDHEDVWMSFSEEILVLRNQGLLFLSETDTIQRIYTRLQSDKTIVQDLTSQLTKHL